MIKDQEEMQKKIAEIRYLEDQISQMEGQIRIVDREIMELQNLILSLDEIKNMKNKEAIIPLGKDIFVKSNINKGDEIFVNIGSKTIVKKSNEETKKLLEDKKDKFFEARDNIGREAGEVIQKIEKIEKEIIGMQDN